jgi:hypothetical protein
LSSTGAVTDESVAIEVAHSHATGKGLLWGPPVDAVRLFHRGRPCWFVKPNANMRGHSVEVVIDDASGEVIEVRTTPR